MSARYEFSTDEKHKATLDLLSDVLAYLRRLPAVPLTLDVCQRIEDHLAEPTQVVVAQTERELFGSRVTPAGVWVMQATLVGQRLSLQVPDPKSREHGSTTRRQVAMEVMTRLWGEGVIMQMTREKRWKDRPVPDCEFASDPAIAPPSAS